MDLPSQGSDSVQAGALWAAESLRCGASSPAAQRWPHVSATCRGLQSPHKPANHTLLLPTWGRLGAGGAPGQQGRCSVPPTLGSWVWHGDLSLWARPGALESNVGTSSKWREYSGQAHWHTLVMPALGG